jgi:citrate synthase
MLTIESTLIIVPARRIFGKGGSAMEGSAVKVSADGLEGYEVACTALSEVDGTAGRLVVVGHQLHELQARASFEDVCGLLWEGELADGADRLALRRGLGAARCRAFHELPRLGAALHAADAMDALRGAVAQLRASGPFASDRLLVTGAVAVYAAAWARIRMGQEPIPPDADLGHAADYLRMSTGAADDRAPALDAYLVTTAEHGMNASTFAARVVASTGSDLVSAVVAALGALKGPLHGGAPGLVLEMLDAVGAPERAAQWLQAELDAGRRIMGMGHRVYRVRDPRAAILEQVLEGVAAAAGGARLELARAVEKSAQAILAARHPERPLRANVEFYTAVLLEALGLPRQSFTATFAVARVAGWCAHVAEQALCRKLIRPSSRYVGRRPGV